MASLFETLLGWIDPGVDRLSILQSVAGLPFIHARVLKASKVEAGKFVDSGNPHCTHIRSVPAWVPIDWGLDSFGVTGYYMNSGDLYAQCQECLHERVYPKFALNAWEQAVQRPEVAAWLGMDTFDEELAAAVAFKRVGSAEIL